MVDTRTPEQRRRIMKSVRTKDTGPELAVRKALRSIGVGYRLHPKDLPGRPDVAFKGRKKAIFVHGCYWHGHDCKKGRLPKSKLDYWGPKIEANKERDARKEAGLRDLGYDVETIWQCEVADTDALTGRLEKFLGVTTRSRLSDRSAVSSDRGLHAPGESRIVS